MATSNVWVRLQRAGADQPRSTPWRTKASPIDEQYDAAIAIPGQPRFAKERRGVAADTGDLPQTDGYITFAVETLRVKGITDPRTLRWALVVGFQRDYGGDTQVDEIFQICEVRNRGHLSGGPILVKAFFKRYSDLHGGV